MCIACAFDLDSISMALFIAQNHCTGVVVVGGDDNGDDESQTLTLSDRWE